MKIYFLKSLCKRCPHYAVKECDYKKAFYEKFRKLKISGGFKLTHKCTHYRQIFQKGQNVLVDLHHRVMMPNGRWNYVLAHENVPGIITGTRGCKFTVELLEYFLLSRKNNRSSQTDYVKLVNQCSKIAKDIKPIMHTSESLSSIEHLRVVVEENDLVLS